MKLRKLLRLSCCLMTLLGCVGGVTAFSRGNISSDSTKNVDVKRANSNPKYLISDDYVGQELSDFDSDFTVKVTSSSYSDVCQTFIVLFTTENYDNDYMLGYYGKDELNLPLIAKYTEKYADGSSEVKEIAVPNSSTNSLYNGFGAYIKDDNISLTVDLPKEKTSTVSYSDLSFYNVFLGNHTSSGYLPDTDQKFTISNLTANTAGKKNVGLNELIDTTLLKVTNFNGFASFEVKINNHSTEKYNTEKSKIYNNNLDDINNGTIVYQYSFPSLAMSYLRLHFKDGTSKDVRIMQDALNSSIYLDDSDSNILHFIVKEVDINSIKSFSLVSLSFQVKLIYSSTSKEVVSSTYKNYFGEIPFEFADNNPVVQNDTLIMIIAVLIVGVLASAGSTGLFIYKRNKYKNDEFKRVIPSVFAKTAIFAVIALMSLTCEILSIVFRLGNFANTLYTFNPLDNLIVVLSVALIFFVGYFGVYFYKMIKNKIAENRAIKLKIDADKADDGTK